MDDLSGLLKPDPVTALTPTSQAGGHVPRSNENAVTARGSVPAADHSTFAMVPVTAEPPVIEKQEKSSPGDDGKPQARGEDWSPPGPPSWKGA